MSIDGHLKHSKAAENTRKNSFSTLVSALGLFAQTSAVQRQQPLQVGDAMRASCRYSS